MEYYRRHTAALREQAWALDPFERIERLQQFTFFSANLANFMPHMDYGQHIHLFREARLNQQLSHVDQRYFDRILPYRVAGWDSKLVGRLKSRPGIICTLHMGSYRLLNYLLAKEGVPFAVLMSSEASQRQGEGFRQLFDQVRRVHDGARLAIIEAESREGVWQMMRYLKAGYNLLVYADGYGGLQTDRHKLLGVPFLAQHLLVRQGVAFIAAKMRVPLYPMVSLRNQNGDISVLAEEPLDGADADSPSWPRLAMTWLFACFGRWIAQRPAQWENWFFMHQQIDLRQVAFPESLMATKEAEAWDTLPVPDTYGLYSAQGRHYLLRKLGYESYPIAETMFAQLRDTWRESQRVRLG